MYHRLRKIRTRPWESSPAIRRTNVTYLKLNARIETLSIEKEEHVASDMVRKVRMMQKPALKRKSFRHSKLRMVH